jgi:GR25 family glycosyltransferase involved in LPS biosynthesis
MARTKMLKTYVITVKNSDREAWMARQLEKFSEFLDVEFIRMPPGNELNWVELAVQGIIKLFPMHRISEKLYNKDTFSYTPVTLGCMLGHYSASKRIIENGDDFAMIMEDNVELDENFNEAVKSALKTLSDTEFDILHLFSSKHDEERSHFADSIYNGRNEWGTAKIQIVSKNFARFAIDNIPFHEVADGITSFPSISWIPTNLKSYAVIPHPAKMSTSFPSIRSTLDRKNIKFSTIYERIPNSKSAFFAGVQTEDSEKEVYVFNDYAYMVCFGVGRARLVNDKFILSGILTALEIKERKFDQTISELTPASFIRSGETRKIHADNEFEILTKSNLMHQISDNEYLFVYIREQRTPRMHGKWLHHSTDLGFLYEGMYTLLK